MHRAAWIRSGDTRNLESMLQFVESPPELADDIDGYLARWTPGGDLWHLTQATAELQRTLAQAGQARRCSRVTVAARTCPRPRLVIMAAAWLVISVAWVTVIAMLVM